MSRSPEGNILGIDYGTRRIGTAIADRQTRIAFPHVLVQSSNDITRDARRLADLGQERQVAEFVVGLPLNMSAENGSDSPQTQLTRQFAAELARLSGKPVHLQDERLSSFAAAEVLTEAGVSAKSRRRKGLTDLIAAQKILQAYLDSSGS